MSDTPFGVELPSDLGAAPEVEAPETASTEEAGRDEQDLGEEGKPETPNRELGDQRADSAPEKEPKFLDLDKLERFRFGGKEWRPKDLQKAILRQQDYTRKTQELSAQQKVVEESHKYATNFEYDLQKVLATPELIEQMRQIYPPHYVALAEKMLHMTPKQQSEVSDEIRQNAAEQRAQLDPQTKKEIEELKAWKQSQMQQAREAEIARIESDLNVKFDKLGAKYPEADGEVVNNRALAYVQKTGRQITDQQLETLFKQHHEQMSQRYTARQKAKVEEQRKVNAKGRDTGAGGSTAGSPAVKVPFRKVKDLIQQDIDAGRFS